jgi:hypothetical protein
LDNAICAFFGRAAALREDAGIGVQTDHLLEQVSKADGQHAGAAADIQKPAAPVQTRRRIDTVNRLITTGSH